MLLACPECQSSAMFQCMLSLALATISKLFDHLSVEHKTIRSCADRLHSFDVLSIHDRHLVLFTYDGCSWPTNVSFTCGLPFDDSGEALPIRPHQQASSIFVDILGSRCRVRGEPVLSERDWERDSV